MSDDKVFPPQATRNPRATINDTSSEIPTRPDAAQPRLRVVPTNRPNATGNDVPPQRIGRHSRNLAQTQHPSSHNEATPSNANRQTRASQDMRTTSAPTGGAGRHITRNNSTKNRAPTRDTQQQNKTLRATQQKGRHTNHKSETSTNEENRHTQQSRQRNTNTNARQGNIRTKTTNNIDARTKSQIKRRTPVKARSQKQRESQQGKLNPQQVADRVYQQRHGRRREGALLLLLLLGFLAVILWFVLQTSLKYLEVREVTLPNLVGQPINVVEAELARLGLKAEQYDEETREVAANHVSSQNPTAGAPVRQGRRVLIGVNRPKQEVSLVPLVGRGQEEALDILEELNLIAGNITYVSDDEQPMGTVLATEPESSSRLTPNSSVNLTVSRGSGAAMMTMPQLVGLSVAEAERRLRALGVGHVDKVLSGIGDSRVTQHSPVAGEIVLTRAPVTLYYNTRNNNIAWVPNLRGKSIEQAYNEVSNAGLTVNSRWISYIQDPSEPNGIITQSPSSGWALRNSPIALVVNRYNPTSTVTTPSTPPSLTGSPTGVGPVSGGATFVPNTPLANILGNSNLQPPTIQPPTIDSANSNLDNVPLLVAPNSPEATEQPNITPPSVQPNNTGFTTLRPVNTLPATNNNTTVIQPLPPSQLPLNNAPIINPVPSTPFPLAPNTPAPSTPVPSTPLPAPPSTSESPVTIRGSVESIRTLPVSFNAASHSFLQGRTFRYRLVANDLQGERTLIDRQMTGNDAINQRVTVYGNSGQVELRTYIDDDYFQAWTP